jgi:uncharacterized protein involved in outer membrane biogenesis
MPWTLPLRRHRWLLVLLTVVLLLVVAFSVPWRLNFARDWIAERTQAATGRALRLDGDIWWHWGRVGRLEVNGLRFANPPWAGRPDMVTARSVDARVALWPLLTQRRLQVVEVRMHEPDVWLESNAQGQRNWLLDTQQSDEGSRIELGRVWLDGGVLRLLQPHLQTDVQARFQSVVAQEAQARLRVEAQGQWNGLAVRAGGVGDDVLQLREANKPYGLDVDASIGRTRVRAAGQVTGLMAPKAADLRIDVRGATLAEWYRIAHVGLPETPAYQTAGRVRLDRGVWWYEDFTSRVGKSDLSGQIRFERRPTRPFIGGRLHSKLLDLKDLGPVVGKTTQPVTAGPAAERAAQAASALPDAAASRPAPRSASGASTARVKSGRVLPQRGFSAEKWDTLDADLQFEAQAIRNLGSMPFDHLKTRVVMDDRKLTLDPLRLGFAGGSVAGSLQIDGRVQPMAAQLAAQFSRLQLEQLLPRVRNTRAAFGLLNGRARLAGRGNSYAQMLGTSQGEMQLAMGRGRISNLLIELVDLDLAEALKFLVAGDRNIPVRCALADVGFERGVMSSRAVVFDTADTIVDARGTADLANERLDLKVTPLPKDKSPLALRVPFTVQGSFADPSVKPEMGKLLARGGGALLLGALVNPIAALIPLIETGPGQDSDCSALMARARGEGVKAIDAEPPAAGAGKR